MGDQDALQLGLIENLQRADLTAIDEALGYRRLSDEFKQTQEDISRTVGKSRPHVANTVAPPRPAGRGAGDDPAQRAFSRPGAGVDRRARSAGRGAACDRREADGARPRASGRRAQAQGQGRRRPKAEPAPAAARAPTPRRWRSASKKRWASRPTSSCAGLGEQSLLTLEIRDFDQLDTVVERLTRALEITSGGEVIDRRRQQSSGPALPLSAIGKRRRPWRHVRPVQPHPTHPRSTGPAARRCRSPRPTSARPPPASPS